MVSMQHLLLAVGAVAASTGASDPLEAPMGLDDECLQAEEGTEPTCGLNALQLRSRARSENATSESPVSLAALWSVPSGVNLGGWLVLEDWFFSGTSGRHVSSMGTTGQGVELPPLLWGMESDPWQSEGLLTKHLVDTKGAAEAAHIIEAHRLAFITDSDLQEIAKQDIKSVRVPLPWTMFADALYRVDPKVYYKGAKIVPDPYYRDQASFVTVDRDWLQKFLRQCAQHNLKVVLDFHFMPSGSSDGTYNGIWPLPPKFWTGGVHTPTGMVQLTEVGNWLVDAFVKWVEILPSQEFSVVEGITILNEPAHMAAINRANGKPFTDSEQQVLDWFRGAAGFFQRSTLPSKGKKLYISFSEPAFANFWETVPAWYTKTFTSQERHSWAVFDIHWYTAWGGAKCSGRTVSGGAYLCNQPVHEIQSKIHKCIEADMQKFAERVDGLKACSEFSLGTFENPTMACNNRDTLYMYLGEQLSVFKQFHIEPFFWTWRMPYGKNFESGWSLKWIAGLEK